MTTAVSVRTVRSSPFRESEWDSRLDHLLEDLENSAQRSHSVERKTTTFASASASQSSCVQSGVLSKSKSTSSLTGAATDNMLKDLDTALKASTNYIESHRSVQLPNGHQEYHESRYTSTSGVPPSSTGDFNLERQVFSTATVVHNCAVMKLLPYLAKNDIMFRCALENHLAFWGQSRRLEQN